MRRGKQIFDPFMGKELPASAERKQYSVFQTCYRCQGTGKGICTKVCSLCNGYRGQTIQKFPSDLTDNELESMSPSLRNEAIGEIHSLQVRNYQARIESTV